MLKKWNALPGFICIQERVKDNALSDESQEIRQIKNDVNIHIAVGASAGHINAKGSHFS
jgi:hypothetical protein